MNNLKNNKIFIYDHIHSREFSELYLSNYTEYGQLFIILELPKHKIDQQPLVDEIIHKIANWFEVIKKDTAELLLEEILQQVNQWLPDLSTNIKIRNWLSTIDLAIGIMDENNVYLATLGNINALLIHSNQFTPILEKSEHINPTKIFSDITSGQLDTGDTLIVSTNSLFDYISKEKIKQIVQKYSPTSATVKLNELLATVPDFVTFNSFIIKNSGETDVDLKPSEIQSTAEELITDDTIEVDTAKIVGYKPKSSLKPVKTKLVVDWQALQNINSVKKLSGLAKALALFLMVIKNTFVFLGVNIKNIVLFIFSSKYRKRRESETLHTITDRTSNKIYWWQNLSAKKKIGLISLFVIALILLQSLVFLTQKKAVEKTDEAYNQLLRDVNTKFNEVATKLIYEDEPAAEEILLQIDSMLTNQTVNSEEQQNNIQELADKVFHELNKVRHIHEVPAPAEVYDLSTVLNTQSIVQKNGNFYILGDNKLWLIKDNSLTEVFSFPEDKKVNSMADWPNEDKVVMSNLDLDNKMTYFIFDLNTKQIADNFNPSDANTSLQDLAIYGDNLYVLDNINSQIFKYPEYRETFANGVAWLNTETDFSQTSSFTIDGSIYTIDNNGKIRNFLKGVLKDFNYHEPRPIIGPQATIKTFKDSNYLYIIDPANSRIIILTKEGNIQDQYTSQKFDNLIDLAVDPNEKAIYLLNGNHLYLLAIN